MVIGDKMKEKGAKYEGEERGGSGRMVRGDGTCTRRSGG